MLQITEGYRDKLDASRLDGLVGKRIRERRHALGLSLEALGTRVGVSFQQVSKYESGQTALSGAMLRRVAGALEVPVAFLVPESTPDDAAHRMLSTREGLQMAEAFVVLDPLVRRQVVALVVTMAARSSS